MKVSKLAYADVALFSGLISIFVIIIPLTGAQEFLSGTKDVILSLLFGIMGVVMSTIQSKMRKDPVRKAAFWFSIIGIITALIKGAILIFR